MSAEPLRINSEESCKELKGRILNVLPAATYQLDRFFQFSDIVLSDETETACVEIGPQPRLHLNAKFIARYCRTDEKLLMLVLHELYHVILGHTRLFPRVSVAHNIAFDAVINALLCHQFREKEYLDFFRRINSARHFPSRLLRPPTGWPGKVSLPSDATADERKVIKHLYGRRPGSATYGEILDLLQRGLPTGEGDFVLIGDHAGPEKAGEKDELAVGDKLFQEVLGRLTGEWPAEANLGTGIGSGVPLEDYILPKPKGPKKEFVHALKQLFQKAGIIGASRNLSYAWKSRIIETETASVLSDGSDRQSYAFETIFGVRPLFFKSTKTVQKRRWTPQETAHVYIDISGSMHEVLPWIVGALEPIHRKGQCRLYAFSTVVDEVGTGTLTNGRLKNTYGTNIQCVLDHILGTSLSKIPKKCVIITDGYTGQATFDQISELKRRGSKLLVGLVEPADERYLIPIADEISYLPSPS